MKKELAKIVNQETFIAATLSNIAKKSIATYDKVTIKKLKSQSDCALQITYHYAGRVIHENCSWQDGLQTMTKLLSGYFKQAVVKTRDDDYHILANKKGNFKILKRRP